MKLHTNQKGRHHYIATAFVKRETRVEKPKGLDGSTPMSLLLHSA